MRTILAIDQSMTSSGIVVIEAQEHPKFLRGHYQNILYAGQFTTEKVDYDCWINDCVIRAGNLATYLNMLIDQHQVTNIIYEAPSLGSAGSATRSLACFLGALLPQLPKHIPTGNVAPTTLKKFAVGKGNAKKEDMLAAINHENPKLFKALNELSKSSGKFDITDAYWLSQFLINELNNEN